MGKVESLLALVFVAILLTLFLMSSTNIIIKDNEDKVYKISVIIDEPDDSYWNNFKTGMSQAAKKLNTDISFVTLYEDDLEDSQVELVKREVNNGAQAIIISPVNTDKVEKMLDAGSFGIPVISLKEGINSKKVTAVLSADYYQMGMEMGKAIAKSFKDKGQNVEAVAHKSNGDIRNYCSGLKNTLTNKGFSIHLSEWNTKDELKKLLADKKGIFVGTDTETMENIPALTAGNNQESIFLCGQGLSQDIISSLDSGKIRILSLSNYYDMGYLSVKLAVKAINNNRLDKIYRIKSYCIPAEQMYDKKYSMILFPIS